MGSDVEPKDGDTRSRGRWVESWHDDVRLWSILCSVEEWARWQIEGADRCHDPVNRNILGTGPDTTEACIAALEEAAEQVKGLPRDGKQNYEIHVAISNVRQMVQRVAAGVCFASEVSSGK